MDSEAELVATLASFFTPSSEDRQHPQCRFIARYEWLKKQLALDVALLPTQECPRFRAWRDAIDARNVALVFASAYINSPASMYGHTFLRVDAIKPQPLALSYTLGYAAEGLEVDGLAFALKGVFGWYRGALSSHPYYLKIREYNDMESRDLWEYELDLKPEEVERLIQHAWEIGSSNFRYYFFDENCSYMVLVLLDVARPSLRLADQFPWVTIPTDTVKSVLASGAIKRIEYRPSQKSIMGQQVKSFSVTVLNGLKDYGASRTTLDQLLALLRSDEEQIPQHNQTIEVREAALLSLADNFLVSLGVDGKLDKTELARKLFELRQRRSTLVTAPDVVVPRPQAPETGHASARVMALWKTSGGEAMTDFVFRPAFHDLMDPQAGFVVGAHIDFGQVTLRKKNNQPVQLQSFEAVAITSITPNQEKDVWRNSLSWFANFGATRLDQKQDDRLHDVKAAQVSAGAGHAWGASDAKLPWLAWYFLGSQALASSAIDHGAVLGLNVSANVQFDVTSIWRVVVGGKAQAYDHQLVANREIWLQQRWVLTPRWVLTLGVDQALAPLKIGGGSVGLRFYFD